MAKLIIHMYSHVLFVWSSIEKVILQTFCLRTQWLRDRASDSRPREPGFESYAVARQVFFILHCSSSLSCINEYLAIDTGGYVYEQPSRIIVAHGWMLPREAEMVSE